MSKKMNIYPPSENLPDLPDFAVAAKDEHRANSFALSRQSSADEVSAAQQEDPFADLQSLWDEQSRRIDHLLAAHPEARPARLNLRHRRPWRRRVMTEYLILIILNVAAGIYTLFALLPDPYILIRITGIVLASTNAFLALHSLYFYFVIRRHHPARVSVARMSRFIRRMHMEPHYAPQPRKRRPRIINVDLTSSAQLHLGKASKLVLRSTFAATRNAVNTAISSARQVAAVSAAALVVLTAVSCSPIGDGHAMTKADRASRTVAVEYVDSMISQI